MYSLTTHCCGDVICTAASAERALVKAKCAGISFRGVELRHFWLHQFDFSGMDLRDADLTGSEFPGSNFEGADLSNAIVGNTKFYRCNMRHVNVTGVAFDDDSLSYAATTGMYCDKPASAVVLIDDARTWV